MKKEKAQTVDTTAQNAPNAADDGELDESALDAVSGGAQRGSDESLPHAR